MLSWWIPVTAMAVAQVLVLLIPWAALAVVYSGYHTAWMDPYHQRDQHRTLWNARVWIEWPVAIGLGWLGSWWIGPPRGLVLAVFTALLARATYIGFIKARRRRGWWTGRALELLLTLVFTVGGALLAERLLERYPDPTWMQWAAAGAFLLLAPMVMAWLLSWLARIMLAVARV
ncbi:hypothetical protein Afil01_63480 [Actinorhabdospora filicis]|uniref:Uncharacterized protein n=1 Tax=Actinorhabdospora filicis TaxID=1785913 RepID=A0A9W6SSC2_9ACTN|nr:hypothetical protein [Actinorhabdospora filicis]GLZ81541.1 hypothetical protein Afil01_63480 [Actinorhabdospora filicis]